ncbi:cohesin subunit SA-2 [Scaptodrosophila lebanonensis]|uniref:Cohesin subunit SA-2 n=1 Tax=Drosophila lebanonensis TaxID=7225 RepID=A0A6J2TV08_DROLE|nr:cohesin subunit SA-2 [Scaptodrosophila lebanonensis]
MEQYQSSSDMEICTPTAEQGRSEEDDLQVVDISSEECEMLDDDDGPEQVQSSELRLFSLVRRRRLKVDDICLQFIASYRNNARMALLRFMQFVVDASSLSEYQVPENLAFPFPYNEILESAYTANIVSGLLHPPVNMASKHLKEIVANFVQTLLKTANDSSIIFNDSFLQTITDFISTCCDSNIRSVRYTGTLIGVKMLTTLNDLVAVEYTKLEPLWMGMFTRVFLKRCRDVVEAIRLICIDELGIWLLKYPQCFLKQFHIEHLFEALMDKASKVRESSLMSLLELFKNESLQPLYQRFGMKFEKVLLAFSVNTESEVGEYAVKLLVSLYNLSKATCQIIDKLVFAADRGLAQAAAELVNYRLKLKSEVINGPGEQHSTLIRKLLKFFLDFGEHEHTAYYVDALYNTNDIIVDWSCMVNMLLVEPSEDAALSSREVSVLIDIMVRGIKQSVTGEIPQGRYTKDLTRQPNPSARLSVTEIFEIKLSQLILKYRCNDNFEDLINLIKIPRYMDLTVCITGTLSTQWHQLLDHLVDIMFKNPNDRVLKTCAKTLSFIFGTLLEFPSNILEARRREFLQNAVINYKMAEKTWHDSALGTHESRWQRLLDKLKILTVIYAYFDLSSWSVSASLFSNFQKAATDLAESSMPEAAVHLYLEVCYMSLSWDLKNLTTADVLEAGLNEACESLHQNRDTFLQAGFTLIECTRDLRVSERSFEYVCDVLVLFGDQLRRCSTAAVRNLEYKSKMNEHELLESFLKLQIFMEEPSELVKEARIEELQRNRRLLISYCKLVSFNVVPMMRASSIFQYFDQYYKPYGDILRFALERILPINPINFGMTLLHTCIGAYNRFWNLPRF